ncbi:sodium:solute symporter [Labilibaculum sp. DW002]|uniref:Sodium:solute symporter n=1 Tax=Paralabilibaculum antarcticum TaxID=2912572 RepID=A0ABT5VYI1_9BACT|nr:sodium:solute symporter [Labilibaculum sp. DW002]MDE5420406.1 sodium:solute symporter [Labilibaculum sp. DW002]
MNIWIVFSVVFGYFGLLMLISWITSRNSNNETFFTGNRKSPWYLVAFGMIGASLSGVTFISVPGEVGNTAWSYFQFVLGNFVGYFVVAQVLIPLYYRLKLVSIYSYLNQRFGIGTYKIGSFFFLVSQTIGASFRLFLVAGVLQLAFFNAFGIPFWVTVFITILLIWAYTFRGGIKTIVWTDTLQTLFMLGAVIITIIVIVKDLDLSTQGVVQVIGDSEFSSVFNWDWRSPQNFFKQFFAGIAVVIVMNGLDQNMMQKNLTCKNTKEAQKNIYWFSLSFVLANLMFLCLGVLLYVFAEQHGITLPQKTDDLYAFLALNHFGLVTGVVFLLGITAAAYSSADSALTALTTSFCVDFLKGEVTQKKRLGIHLMFSAIMFVVIVVFSMINDQSVVTAVFKVAGYTYGPLLGLFAFGLGSSRIVRDKWVPLICVLSPIITYMISTYSEQLLWGYRFGFELLIVNGLITFLGLVLISERKRMVMSNTKSTSR